MNEKFTLTGGARIGMSNASFPLADLYVDKNVLKINASIVGNLVFQPNDIISIEAYSSIPVIGNGIKINHRIEKYSSKVIFWTFKNPITVINEIRKTGFLDNIQSEITAADLEIINRQNQGGFPIKKPVAIFYVVIWNALFLSDIIPFFLQEKQEGFPIGNGIKLALAIVFVSAILTLVSAKFRSLILKERRELDDIKKFVYLLLFISGMLFLQFSITCL
ncbi:hypothetical protein ACFSJW_06005 [Flavobacterium artemisiae]|uniref:Uncharacterized protein n=1 Tax=Flavobacterium artemisiae TaxID=2126556 RepID=A0ABW4HJK7_9FLAO